MNYDSSNSASSRINPVMQQQLAAEALRLEAVTACVGFDDVLDVTLAMNHPQVDTMIVVTSHEDVATQQVARKHGAICVQTDPLKKNARGFNKGAAINAGIGRFQYHGWRLHLDADIILADNFRRMIFNHTQLDPDCLYGADRIDVIGMGELTALKAQLAVSPQAANRFLIDPSHLKREIGHRYVDTLRGYCPMGFFQMWNARCQHEYPWSAAWRSPSARPRPSRFSPRQRAKHENNNRNAWELRPPGHQQNERENYGRRQNAETPESYESDG